MKLKIMIKKVIFKIKKWYYWSFDKDVLDMINRLEPYSLIDDLVANKARGRVKKISITLDDEKVDYYVSKKVYDIVRNWDSIFCEDTLEDTVFAINTLVQSTGFSVKFAREFWTHYI